jgi:large subunit ribosomal protein L31
MKKGIHPTIFLKAKTTCTTCGTVFEIPSTVEKQTVEICRMCHPVYTGKKQTEARGGRVERFRKRMAEGKKKETTAPKATKAVKAVKTTKSRR